MTSDERLEKLEQRLSVLEGLVRQLVAQGPLRSKPSQGTGRSGGPGTPTAATPPPAAPGQADYRALAAQVPTPAARPPVDGEQWFGQRGLLAVGVVFVILAAGYLLKLSFDRDWISPATRCAGGALAGLGVGALGHRLHRKGLFTYGAALIGCGAAIIYLAVWAAARLYGFLPPATAIVGLALVSLSLAAIAYLINVEALGATAALGAFFAPALLGQSAADVNTLLLYLGFMGIAMGWVSARRQWRMTMVVVAASYFGQVLPRAAESADPHLMLAYALFGGSAGLYVGLREGWWETRILAFSGGWSLLALANQSMENPGLTLAGAIVLAAPVWWRGFHSVRIWPSAESTTPGDQSSGETFYFYLTPVLLAWATYQVAPAAFDRNGGLVAMMVAIPYLLAGYQAVRVRFALVGTTAVLAGILLQWEGLAATWAALAAAVLWAALDHPLRRTDGRWYGLLALVTAVVHLLHLDLPARTGASPAFRDDWALALWATTVALAAYGAGLWRREPEPGPDVVTGVSAFCWAASGLALLFGVTGELHRYFQQSTLPQPTAALASGLGVSAWWIAFAAGLVLFGFGRNRKTVRIAGLAVAGMAVLKVVVFDLSTLDALYRVGSVLILGVVSLGIAYLYHRQARTREA